MAESIDPLTYLRRIADGIEQLVANQSRPEADASGRVVVSEPAPEPGQPFPTARDAAKPRAPRRVTGT